MPPFKQPVQLFDGALRTLNTYIVESCQNIQMTYGKYSELKCQEAVQEIQDYLLACLPYHLLETMCSKIHLIFTEFNFPVDSIIISSVFLHKNCQKFYPQFELVSDNAFWRSKICMLEKIVVLNLKMVCTDDVLEVVGANCKSLEYINIVSRVVSDSTNYFNALKLKFFVSDKGLKFLIECKNLKKIVMTKVVRSQCAGSKITHSGISLLLKSLPKLEVISYSDMGSVIDEIYNVDSLSLTSISDCHPVPQRILKISSLCPYLTELFLHLPINLNDSTPENLGDDILIQLSKSNLQLGSLNLNHFPLNDSFNEFIKVKGKHLTTLFLSKHITVSGVIDAVMLGYHCPNIQFLHLKGVGISQVDPDMTDSNRRKSIYTNLKCLTIENKFGGDVDFSFILPVFLDNAKNITCINLDNFGKMDIVDKPLQSVMKCNPFTDLQKANFFRGAFLSFEFLMKFTFFCSKLKHLTVHECGLLSEKNVEDFKRDLKAKNYDITINILPIRPGF